MNMNGDMNPGTQLDPMEILKELENQFPRELQIVVQAVYIRKLQEQLSEKESNV
ncbi:MAG: hypothetical protein ABWY25_09085 [Paenisporosarcina sp.]